MALYLQMIQGIQGGIVEAKVRRAIEISSEDGSVGVLTDSRLNPSSSSLRPSEDDYTMCEGTLSGDTMEPVREVLAMLGQLPRQDAEFSNDIYGLDTAIEAKTDDFEWRNGAPSGCVHQVSTKGPTSEDKQKFKLIVDSLLSLADKHAK